MVYSYHKQIHASLSPLAKQTLKLLLWIIVLILAIDILVYFSLKFSAANDYLFFEDALKTINSYTNTDTERTIPAWFSGGLWFVSGATAASIAAARSSFAWKTFAVICALLSFDEIVGLHEGFGSQAQKLIGNQGGLLNFEWVVIGAILAVGLSIVGYQAVKTLNRNLKQMIFVAGAVFVLGALVFESISGYAIDNYGNQLFYHSMAWIEEALEMVGVSLLLATLISATGFELKN